LTGRSTAPAEPTFSVVMPAYNTGFVIETGIRSVLLQSRSDLELIIVDDGSTDDTAERVAAFQGDRRVRLIRQENRGPSAARNAGLAVARGRFVTMLDSDDLLLPRYLEVMAAALEREPGAGLAYTDARVLDQETGRIRRTTMMAYQRPPKVPPANAASFFRLLLDRNFICPTVTVRRAAIDRVGGFDERLWRAEEWELWLRIVYAGHRAVRPPGVLVVHRDRPGSLSTDLAKMIEGVLEVYRIVDEEYEPGDDVRTIVRKKRAYWDRYLRTLTDPDLALAPSERGRALARAVKQRVSASRLWLKTPPAEVADVLRACGALTNCRSSISSQPSIE
jgi:glycosyltransferase involved in cell wall biosynthesis